MLLKHSSKSIIAFFVVVVLGLSLIGYGTPLKVYGTESNKNVTKTADGEGNKEDRIYELKFSADLKKVLINNRDKFPIDVILLVDMSTSMNEGVVGTDKSRLEVMKEVATEFVDELATFSDNSTLSIATYYNSSEIIINPVKVNSEDNKNLLKSAIAGITHKPSQLGGTNHDYGFMRAEEILENSLSTSTNQKYIILLTDGQPNAQNRDTSIDELRYPEITNGTTVKYFKFATNEYVNTTITAITSRNILRDLCVTRILGSIKTIEPSIKVATVGFEIADDEGQHVQALFDVVTGVDLATGQPTGEGGGRDYQFYTSSSTSLANIFDALMENFAEENTVYKRPVIIDYIAAEFIPLNDKKEPITIEEARKGVTLSNGAVISYDDEKKLYYVIWGEEEALDIDIEWNSSIYIGAKDDFAGGKDIETNEEDSGVYVDELLIEEFPIPTVDVYIRKYDIIYEFESGTEGKTLPKEVMDLLPQIQENIDDGSTVIPIMPENTEVLLDKGRWTFVSWDEQSKVIKGANQKFKGKWVYTEYQDYPTYEVIHTFKSGTEGKKLPKKVLELLPENQTDKKDGSKVKPTALIQTEVKVKGGKWIFKVWDAEEKRISRADQTFVGTWEYVDTYEVIHKFVSGTKGKTLPKKVMDLLPKPQTYLDNGSKVKPTSLKKTEVYVKGGKWVFKHWDDKQKTINSANENFEGEWVFIEIEPDEQETPGEPLIPVTEDSNNVNVWYVVSIISLLVMLYMVLTKKKILKK